MGTLWPKNWKKLSFLLVTLAFILCLLCFSTHRKVEIRSIDDEWMDDGLLNTMDKIHIQLKSGIGLPKSDNPEILSVIDICCLAQFMKWAVMQEILKLHRIAQFMNWALRVSCYCPFHELGNSAAQFINWTISQIGRNIYIFRMEYELHVKSVETFLDFKTQ